MTLAQLAHLSGIIIAIALFALVTALVVIEFGNTSERRLSLATAHTPGPWVVADEHPDGVLDRCIMAGGYYVATVHDVAADDDCWDADARLIAAAPELLAFAQMFVAIMEADTFAFSDNPSDCFGQARAAIAKATGA